MSDVLPLLLKLDAAIEKQVSSDGHVANAARIFADRLRAVKDLFNLDFVESQIVLTWLRQFAFSDGQFMAGAKLENPDDVWEDEGELEFYECPACKTAVTVDGETILKLGEGPDDSLAEDEGYEPEVGLDICPVCGVKMELVILDATDMLLEIPGDIKALLQEGGPYETVAQNAEFAQALRGGYPHTAEFDPVFDERKIRDPKAEGIWAEYFSPDGIWDFVGEHLGAIGGDWLIGEFSFKPDLWEEALLAYEEGELNAVALAILAMRLEVPEEDLKHVPINVADPNRFLDATHRLALAVSRTNADLPKSKRPASLHLPDIDDEDPTEFREAFNALRETFVPAGMSPAWTLFDFMQVFEWELGEVELDLPREEWSPRFTYEEQSVADVAAHNFEQEMFAHWEAMAKEHKLIHDEDGKVLWAGSWKPEDVAYSKAQFYAILGGLSAKEARRLGNQARLCYLAKRGRLVGVTSRGVELSSGARLTWVDAAQVAKLLKPANRKSILAQLRKLWVSANGNRPSIEAVGRALAA